MLLGFFFLFLPLSTPFAETLELQDGSLLQAEIIESQEDYLLLKTQGKAGSGLLKLPRSLLRTKRSFVLKDSLKTQDKAGFLALAEEFLDREQIDHALEILDHLHQKMELNQEETLLFIRCLRQKGRIQTALYLSEHLIKKAQEPELSLLLTSAELATLQNESKIRTTAFRRLQRSSFFNSELELYLEALKNQTQGKGKVVFKNPSHNLIGFDFNTGTFFFKGILAPKKLLTSQKHKAQLKSLWSENTPDLIHDVRLQLEYDREKYHELFLREGQEKASERSITRVQTTLYVQKNHWLNLYDWKKQATLLASFFSLRKTFPEAKQASRVVLLAENNKQSPIQAEIQSTSGQGFDLKLLTPPYRDPARTQELLEKQEKKKSSKKK